MDACDTSTGFTVGQVGDAEDLDSTLDNNNVFSYFGEDYADDNSEGHDDENG